MKKIIPLLAFLMVFGVNAANAEDADAKLLEMQKNFALKADDAFLLNQAGMALYKAGKYAEAESLLQRSLAIREKTLGKDDRDVARSLSNLAGVYQAQGRYAEAEPLFQRSLAIREKAFCKDHSSVATTLNNLASLYKDQSKYEQAESMYKRSLAIREKALGEDHPDVANVLNNLAELYSTQGKYTEAEPFYQRSLTIWEKELGEDDPIVAIGLNNLAWLYKHQGKYEQAEPLYLRSLAIDEKALGKDHPTVAVDLNNLASLYKDQAKYEQAESLHLRSLAIKEKSLGKDHPKVATSLNNLSDIYDTQGKYEQAEPYFLRSLAIREKALGKDHPNVASTLHNLARFYYKQEKYAQAEPLLKRSLAIREKALGQNNPDVATSLESLASIYKKQGKYAESEPLFLKGLAIDEKMLGQNHPGLTIGLNELAKLYIAMGDHSKADPLLQRSLRIMNQSLERWLWGSGEKTRQSYLKQEEYNRDFYLSFYSFHDTPEEALYFSLSRKGLLLRIASEASILAKQSSDSVIQKKMQEFSALKAQLSNLVLSGKEDKKIIQDLEEKSNNQEMQLSQKVSGFKRSKTEVTPEQVLEKLSDEQSVIDFLVYKEVDLKTEKDKTDQIIALIADKQNGIKLIKLGEFAPIAAAIKTYQSSIVPTKENANNREKTITQTAQTLYEKLWQPLTPYLQNKKTVYLIPDGDLHLLPFKALQDPDGKYLAEKWQLITLSSARDIVLPPLEGKASAAAIFAAPDYGDDTAIIKAGNTAGATELKNIHFDSLPNALNEGQQIDKLFIKKQPEPAAKLFLKAQATEQAINALTAPKILHLSTHGFFLEDSKPVETQNLASLRSVSLSNESLPVGKIENPLTRSGLAFANANFGVKGIKQNDGTDGILTALEVLNLDLAGTDLVTLSACDTGKGDVKIGEGVYSLNRAFQEAGAKAVLSTLWSVADESTGIFMQRFYEHFLNGEPAQQAIQATQNEFMHDAKYKQYSNPYYWAGFVMIGKE